MVGGTRSYEMAKRLVKRGHEVHMITTWRESDCRKDWFREEIEGIIIHWLPVPYSNLMSYRKRIAAFFKYALKAGKKAQSINGDVIFATSTPLTISIPAVAAKKKLNVPMVFEVRDLWPELPIVIGALKNPLLIYLAKKLELYSYRHADSIVALSPGMATGIASTGYNKDDIETITNSADLDLFSPDASKSDSFRKNYSEIGDGPIVLYAGSLGVINDLSYLVKLAAKTLSLNSSVRFVIFGNGAEWKKVNSLAEKLGVLNKNLFMYPSIAKVDLISAFCAATISTSLFIDLKEMEANSANKFFDTLASGTTAAINYGGWQAELLHEYNAGFRLNRDVEAASHSLVRLLNDPEKLNVMAKNARKLAISHFSRDDLALRLEKVLVDAVEHQ